MNINIMNIVLKNKLVIVIVFLSTFMWARSGYVFCVYTLIFWWEHAASKLKMKRWQRNAKLLRPACISMPCTNNSYVCCSIHVCGSVMDRCVLFRFCYAMWIAAVAGNRIYWILSCENQIKTNENYIKRNNWETWLISHWCIQIQHIIWLFCPLFHANYFNYKRSVRKIQFKMYGMAFKSGFTLRSTIKFKEPKHKVIKKTTIWWWIH